MTELVDLPLGVEWTGLPLAVQLGMVRDGLEDAWERPGWFGMVPIGWLDHVETWTMPERLDFLRTKWELVAREPLRFVVGDRGRLVFRGGNHRLFLHREFGSAEVPALVFPWVRTTRATSWSSRLAMEFLPRKR